MFIQILSKSLILIWDLIKRLLICINYQRIVYGDHGPYIEFIKEQIIFPEINIDKVNKISGMDITFVTNTNSNKEAKALLTDLGLPFKKQ